MKKLAIALLLCGSVPASAALQSAGAPPAKRGWSLENVKPKRAQTAANAEPQKAGPALPPPMKVKLPRAKTAAKGVAAPTRPKRANGAPIMAAVARKRQH